MKWPASLAALPPAQPGLIAAVAYWGTFCLWCTLILWVVPPLIIIWRYGKQSAFLQKHALQALCINGLALAVCGSVWFVFWVLGHFLPGWVTYFMLMLAILLFGLGFAAYLAILGILAYQGADPDIPFLTPFLQTYLR